MCPKGYTSMVQSIVISNGNEAMTVVPILSSADVFPFLEGGLRESFPLFVLFSPRLSELSDSEQPDVSQDEEEEISKAATVKMKINKVFTRKLLLQQMGGFRCKMGLKWNCPIMCQLKHVVN